MENLGKNLRRLHEFDYTYVSGENLLAEVEVHYHEWCVIGRVEWKNDLNFPLMYITDIHLIEEEEETDSY